METRLMTHASLFSGIGGAEIAAAWVGWKNVFHCDINMFGCEVLRFWFPDSEEYHDITKTDFTKWGGACGRAYSRIPLPAIQRRRKTQRRRRQALPLAGGFPRTTRNQANLVRW